MKLFLMHHKKALFIGTFIFIQALSTFLPQYVYAGLSFNYQQVIPGKISGKILDENGNPLTGASIKIEGLTQGVTSGLDGSYTLSVEPGTYTLVISFISYQSQKVSSVIVAAGQTSIQNFKMLSESGTLLNEVVVVGYGTQKKENLTGAVDQVTSKTLENRPLTNLTQGLQGVLPNLNIRIFLLSKIFVLNFEFLYNNHYILNYPK